MAEKDFVQGAGRTQEQVIHHTTTSPGERERLFNHPIDILSFGRAGVGKSTLLEALTGRNLGATPRLDHGTTKLQCCDIKEHLPRTDGTSQPIHLRFWDTKGIDKWDTNSGDVACMLQELDDAQVRPLCVLYCANGNGRVDTACVSALLGSFIRQKIAVFYVITNSPSHNEEQMIEQCSSGVEILQKLSGRPAKKFKGSNVWEQAYEFDERTFLLTVNSKPWKGPMGQMDVSNVDLLMRKCIGSMNNEQLTSFFLATLNNRNFWDKSFDSWRSIVVTLQTAGFDAKSFLARLWDGARQYFGELLKNLSFA